MSLRLVQIAVLPCSSRALNRRISHTSVCALVKIGSWLVRECRRSNSVSLQPPRDHTIGSNKEGGQIDRIRNGAVKCNRDDHIPPPGLPDIIIHDDADLEVSQPVSTGEGYEFTRSIILLATLNVGWRKKCW